MNPLKYDKPYQEALGVFEALRKLGFAADDIYFVINGPLLHLVPPEHLGKLQLLMRLQTQGKTFDVACGVVNDTPENANKKWTKLTKAMNEGRLKPEHLDEVWQKSVPHQNAESFLIALTNKGFAIPKAMN